MDKPLLAESLRTLENFTDAIKEEVVSQCSPGLIQWSSIQKLVKIIKQIRIIPPISEVHQEVFLENLIKFVELVMGFLSDDKNRDYRKQTQYAAYALDFLPEILSTVEIRNTFVKHATVRVMSLFMYCSYSLVSKKALINMYNLIAAKTEKSVRRSVAESSKDIMYQLLDCLSIQGDFALQSDILETVFRIFGNEVKYNPKKTHLLVPNSLELSIALANDFSVNNFDIDVRNWLEKFNKDSQNVFSIGCKKVIYGTFECQVPEEESVTWVDFNLKENMLSLCYKETDSWNRLTVPSNYVKKTKVKRPLGASESTILFYLSRPVVSSQNQKFWDDLEKHLKLIISNTEKDKINRLITQVLPQAFGDSFEHGSEKILKHPRPVYKPLGIKVSKKRSDVTSASSVSKSRSEAASTVEANSPRRMLEGKVSAPVSPQSIYISDDGSVGEPKLSYAKMNCAVGSDISSAVITDFTRRSRYGDPDAPLDGVISIASNNSDLFPLNMGSGEGLVEVDNSSDILDAHKVQDNIVTSSHEENIEKFSEIQILSAGSIRASARQTVVQEAFEFERSEILSSSPLKISKQKEDLDISSELFLSTSEHSGDGKEQAETDKNTKVSAVQSQDDIFTEHFETAQEEFAEVEMVTIDKISQYSEIKTLHTELPRLRDRMTNDKPSKIIAKKTNISDTKWTSRLRSRTAKTSEEKRLNAVEDVHSEPFDDDAAQEAIINKQKLVLKKTVEEILTVATSKDVNQAVASNEQFDSNETVEEVLTEASSKDVAQAVSSNEQVDSNETVEAVLAEACSKDVAEEVTTNEQVNHTETKMAVIASAVGLFTEDLEVIEVDSQEDQRYIQGSARSLVVNVGTAESQYSEDTQTGNLQLSKTRTHNKIEVATAVGEKTIEEDKNDEDRGVPRASKRGLTKNCDVQLDKLEIKESVPVLKDGEEKPKTVLLVKKNHKESSVHRDVVEVTQIASKEEEVIDLTLDDLEKSSKQDDVYVAAGKADPMFNTPELLGILQPPIQGKKETAKEIDETTSTASTNEEVVPKKRKKGRTLIKTGKKRFDLEALLSFEADKDKLDIAEKNIHKKDAMKTDSCKKNTVAEVPHDFDKDDQGIPAGVACVAVEEGVKNVIHSGTDILGNENVIVNEPPEEGGPVVRQKEGGDMAEEDTAVEKQASIRDTNKTNATKKKAKGKTFVKKGNNRAKLNTVLSPQADKNLLHDEAEKIQDKDAMETDSCKKDTVVDTSHVIDDENNQEINDGVACVAVKEGVQNDINIGNDILGNENVIMDDQPEESVPEGSRKESETPSSSSQSEILAPEINASNIDYLEKFDELRDAKDKENNVSRPSESHTHITRSQSKILAPEVNASNIVNLEEARNAEIDVSRPLASPNKLKTIESVNDPGVIGVEGEIDGPAVPDNNNLKFSAVGKKGKSRNVRKKRMAKKRVEPQNKALTEIDNRTVDERVEPQNEALIETDNQAIVQDHSDKPEEEINAVLDRVETPKVVAKKTTDSSPDKPHEVVVVVAQVHHETTPLPKQKSAKRPERLVKKTLTEENVSEELRQMEESLFGKHRDPPIIGRTRSSERIRRRSPEDLDRISIEEPAKTKSNERIRLRGSPDDFDKVCQEEPMKTKSFNKSGTLNATGGSRKLFDPANLSYLDKMPALAEQQTPEFSDSPITPPIKKPRKKRTPKKMLEADPENSKKKAASSKKENKPAKAKAEKAPKKRAKIKGKRNFDFSTVDFKSLDELFNTSFAGFGCRPLAQNANRTSYGGFNASAFQPLVVRSAPIEIPSDESPVALRSLLNKNLQGLKDTPDMAESSLEFVWPDVEIENKGKTKKINILQDIVITPKRRQAKPTEPPSAKRKKLFEELPGVPVPVPLDDWEIASVPQQPISHDNFAVPTNRAVDRDAPLNQYPVLPENMEHVRQELTDNQDIERAFKLLEEMTNPAVFNALKTMVRQKNEYMKFLHSRQQ